MIPQAGPPEPPARDSASEYRRLLGALALRARWLGSRDPESAAQESLKRSIENPTSQAAVEFYFGEHPSGDSNTPEWPLQQLMAWLHAVLHYVVREERARAAYSREVTAGASHPEPADSAANPLDALIQEELQAIVVESFPKLEREQRQVLTMRIGGLKYGEIALRMGVNENTVATWVSRGVRELGRHVRRRIGGTR